MTKVLKLEEVLEIEPYAELKKIEFSSFLDSDGLMGNAGCNPIEYETIILLEKNYFTDGTDLMWAVKHKHITGALYKGKFNDGVV